MGLDRRNWLTRRVAGHPISGRARMLPDFFIIGAEQCGAEALFRCLCGHPLISSPVQDEMHFFDFNFHRGIAWYRAHFPLSLRKLVNPKAMTGEVTAYYGFHPYAAQRLRSIAPNAKLILICRNPIDRAVVHYEKNVRHGCEPLSFEAAIEQEPDRLIGTEDKLSDPTYYSFNHHNYAYVAQGMYADQLGAWRRYFPHDQLFVTTMDELSTEIERTLDRTLSFLGLPKHSLRNSKSLCQSLTSELDPAIRGRLRRLFEPHNRRLFGYLGREFSWA